MEDGEVSRGEAEGRKGENKTKGQKPRPGSSWPRLLTATAQQGGVHLHPPHAQAAHLSRSQNALEDGAAFQHLLRGCLGTHSPVPPAACHVQMCTVNH